MKRVGICILLCALLLLSACSGQISGDVTVTDLQGTEVTLSGQIEKIISLSPSTTEILFALGADEKIVGVDASSNYPAEANEIARVGDYNGVNAESVIALEPDVVLASDNLQKETIEQLRAANIPVLSVEAQSLDKMEQSITLIGEVVGEQEAAQTLLKQLADKQNAVKDACDGTTVYYVMSFGEYGNWTSGPGSFINDMIKIVGGHPITEDTDPAYAWMEYSVEALVEADPAVILLDSYAGTLEDLQKTPGYENLTAVKEGCVYTIDSDIINRPGPRVMDALDAIYNALKEEP